MGTLMCGNLSFKLEFDKESTYDIRGLNFAGMVQDNNQFQLIFKTCAAF